MLALITGITGQDGSYLAEFLLEKNYTVYGLLRRSSSFNTERLEAIFSHPKLFLRYGDMGDITSIVSILQEMKKYNTPIEIYNLAAQSHVKVSFEIPVYTANIDAIGTLNILEAIRTVGLEKKCRFYQASTSELYGEVQTIPQNEETPFYPKSPYGVAKLYSFWIVKNYRESYGIYACNGILFNHESPRRGKTFVTRKITYSIKKILEGKIDYIWLGNLNAKRDWGHAKDYVRAMWMMLQQDTPLDLVISTGETHTVREFVELSFKHIGITIKWRGEEIAEEGYDAETGRVYVKIDPRYFRPSEVDLLIGDCTKAKNILGWRSEHNLQDIVTDMMRSELA
jgi:GDPmannose 4,6-dehydratase